MVARTPSSRNTTQDPSEVARGEIRGGEGEREAGEAGDGDNGEGGRGYLAKCLAPASLSRRLPWVIGVSFSPVSNTVMTGGVIRG